MFFWGVVAVVYWWLKKNTFGCRKEEFHYYVRLQGHNEEIEVIKAAEERREKREEDYEQRVVVGFFLAPKLHISGKFTKPSCVILSGALSCLFSCSTTFFRGAEKINIFAYCYFLSCDPLIFAFWRS